MDEVKSMEKQGNETAPVIERMKDSVLSEVTSIKTQVEEELQSVKGEMAEMKAMLVQVQQLLSARR